MLFYENLHHNVLELEVHNGRNRFFLRPHECGAKHNTRVIGEALIKLNIFGQWFQPFKTVSAENSFLFFDSAEYFQLPKLWFIFKDFEVKRYHFTSEHTE